jgi:hypothetical protein
MLILVLCYLPAVMLLVVIPLSSVFSTACLRKKHVYTGNIEADRARLARE